MTATLAIKGYYSGHKPCGCFVAVMMDMEGSEMDIARTMEEWKREGLVISFSQERPDLSKFKRCKCGVLV